MILSVGSHERYKEQLDAASDKIATNPELRASGPYERHQLIGALCRKAMGIDPARDIADIVRPPRERLLYMMGCVRDNLLAAEVIAAGEQSILPPDVSDV